MRGFFGGDSSSEPVKSMGGFFLGCVCVTRGGGSGRGDGARGGGAAGRGDGARGTGAAGRDA